MNPATCRPTRCRWTSPKQSNRDCHCSCTALSSASACGTWATTPKMTSTYRGVKSTEPCLHRKSKNRTFKLNQNPDTKIQASRSRHQNPGTNIQVARDPGTKIQTPKSRHQQYPCTKIQVPKDPGTKIQAPKSRLSMYRLKLAIWKRFRCHSVISC